MIDVETTNLSELTAEIVAAYVSNNNVRPDELPALINDVHAALRRAPGAKAETPPEPQDPAVPIRSSVKPDYIVCLEDGRKFKSLKRHLQGEHGMSPAEYRAKWGLKSDYPMVAPNYSEARSSLAKTMGLGRKSSGELNASPQASNVGDSSTPATPQRTRRSKANA